VQPPVTAALIALAGVLIGLVARDIVMALVLANRKREDERRERTESREFARHDAVRIYGDPLHEAVKALRFRLHEIIDGPARYLLAATPLTKYVHYKRVSTMYRLLALLGWIQAIRRERSYLDPEDEVPTIGPILAIEAALADGQHIENQRLAELVEMWKAPKQILERSDAKRLAAELDAALRDYLAEHECLSASDLEPEDRKKLARKCADLLASRTDAEIPRTLVDARVEDAMAFFGIKEAYLYRDWQRALGDLMLRESKDTRRRYDVIGFGEFEDRYTAARNGSSETIHARRWFDRVEEVFHDLDMTQAGMFDARREQLRKLYEECVNLEKFLASKLTRRSNS
jgi:hypothetical protein